MTDKATPRLPLRAARDSNGTYGIVAADGEPIAYCRHSERAALIVRAVNSYDALRQAALRAFNEDRERSALSIAAAVKARAALKLAKGET